MTCLINILFLRDYWTKSDGGFAEMQMISYNFIIPSAYSDEFTTSKDIDAESPIKIFGTICMGIGYRMRIILNVFEKRLAN